MLVPTHLVPTRSCHTLVPHARATCSCHTLVPQSHDVMAATAAEQPEIWHGCHHLKDVNSTHAEPQRRVQNAATQRTVLYFLLCVTDFLR